MKIGILTECAMAKTHGTGALLLRLFPEAKVPFVHLFLRDAGFGMSECSSSHLLMPLSKWHPRYQRTAHRLLRVAGLSMWRKDEVNPRAFERFRRANGVSCDAAYVVASRETDAQRFVSLLKELKCPYVVHVMDIYHADGLDPKTMPGFKALLQGAHCNLALTDAIRDELAKFDSRPIQIVPVGQDRNPHPAKAPAKEGPLRIVMIGRPYAQGTLLLGETWPQLAKRFGSIELVYIGAHANVLPASMKGCICNLGYVTGQAQFQRLLSEAHLAYLSGPSELDCFGKFSFPSRCSDYLMAGLPVVACVAEGSATERFLQPLSRGCVRFARSGQELVQAVEVLAANREQWTAASEQARAYAQEHLSIETVRNQIMTELEQAFRPAKGAMREMQLS